ncbi:MAG: endonuclease [Elusimicrobia bacterium]|nr:endonuclease [Elusimicrobiota bacterium]
MPQLRRLALALVLPFSAALCGAQQDDAALDSLRRLSGGAPAVEVPAVRAAVAAPAAAAGSGAQLLASLHESSGRGYRQHEYQEASHYMFSTADNVERGGRRGVIDAYSGVFVAGTSAEGSDYRESGDQNGDAFVDSQGMNVEHTWPQSFFSKRLPMKSDLHHLLATFIHPNGMRGSMPFGVVQGQGEYHNDGGAKSGQGVFEPPDAAKGRVARALLYFYTRYCDQNISNGGFNPAFWNQKLELLLSWNRSFPPGPDEMRRNDLIERFQGNRNPFTDDPSLADRVGVDAFQRASRWDGSR